MLLLHFSPFQTLCFCPNCQRLLSFLIQAPQCQVESLSSVNMGQLYSTRMHMKTAWRKTNFLRCLSSIYSVLDIHLTMPGLSCQGASGQKKLLGSYKHPQFLPFSILYYYNTNTIVLPPGLLRKKMINMHHVSTITAEIMRILKELQQF